METLERPLREPLETLHPQIVSLRHPQLRQGALPDPPLPDEPVEVVRKREQRLSPFCRVLGLKGVEELGVQGSGVRVLGW